MPPRSMSSVVRFLVMIIFMMDKIRAHCTDSTTQSSQSLLLLNSRVRRVGVQKPLTVMLMLLREMCAQLPKEGVKDLSLYCTTILDTISTTKTSQNFLLLNSRVRRGVLQDRKKQRVMLMLLREMCAQLRKLGVKNLDLYCNTIL